jgi:hypothetical protein
MKKLGLCLLSLCLVGYVTGCGTEDDATVPTTPPAGTDTDADGDADVTETPAADPPA